MARNQQAKHRADRRRNAIDNSEKMAFFAEQKFKELFELDRAKGKKEQSFSKRVAFIERNLVGSTYNEAYDVWQHELCLPVGNFFVLDAIGYDDSSAHVYEQYGYQWTPLGWTKYKGETRDKPPLPIKWKKGKKHA